MYSARFQLIKLGKVLPKELPKVIISLHECACPEISNTNFMYILVFHDKQSGRFYRSNRKISIYSLSFFDFFSNMKGKDKGQ